MTKPTSDQGTKPFRQTSRSLPIALLRARESVMAPIREMLADAGVTEQQWRVMRVLEEAGPMDGTDLAQRACLLPPSLTRIAQTLEAKGFVERSVSKQDRRRQVFSISPEGSALLGTYAGRAAEIARGFEGQMGKERFDLLLGLLEELQEQD
ncbi:MAG: homoprotocatechuate degradation operon regulator HpaR [Pseudomonadota bacterium]